MYKPPISDYQRAVEGFKRTLLRDMLVAHGGNRTRTAKALGLQRTYLLRLIRDFGVQVTPPLRGNTCRTQ